MQTTTGTGLRSSQSKHSLKWLLAMTRGMDAMRASSSSMLEAASPWSPQVICLEEGTRL